MKTKKVTKMALLRALNRMDDLLEEMGLSMAEAYQVEQDFKMIETFIKNNFKK